MRHTFECPMRWADMDLLGHVNNVTYVDYLQEARIDMFASHEAFRDRQTHTEGVVVVNHQVEFVAPLVYRPRPILVDVWVTAIRGASFSLAYEIYDEADGERVVYLRASSLLAPYVFAEQRPRRLEPHEKELLAGFAEESSRFRPVGGPPSGPTHVSELRLRFTDLDVFGHANNVRYFEFFQEARIALMTDLRRPGEQWSESVVARSDVEYLSQLHFRRRPYDLHTWIAAVGDRSCTISAEIRDKERVIARSHVVAVSFDSATQRSAPMPSDQRAAYTEAMRSGVTRR